MSTTAVSSPVFKRRPSWLADDDIFDILVFFASDAGKRPLIGKSRCFFVETLLAIAEYVDGKEEFSNSFIVMDIMGNESDVRNKNHVVEKLLKKIITAPPDKLDPRLRKLLVQLLEPHERTEDYGNGRWLEYYMENKYDLLSDCSTVDCVDLSVIFVEEVKRELLPAIAPSALKQCRAIAGLMKKYFNRDREYIQKKNI